MLQHEIQRVAELKNIAERDRLHLCSQEPSEVYTDEQLDQMTIEGWNVLPDNVEAEVVDDPDADTMYAGHCGPLQDIIAASKSPLKRFYYFLPKSFWRQVASQTNIYRKQTLEARLQQAEEKEAAVTKRPPRSRAALLRKIQESQKVSPLEVVHWIGAHALRPCKDIDEHWYKDNIGVLPAGVFGRVMSRDRFREITRFLHFTDNKDPAGVKDRAWKIRSLLSVLEQTVEEGYVLGSRVVIDEGILPSHNRRKPTRTFMKDKPHR